MKIVLQNNEQDCLLACYSMILGYFGRDVAIHELYSGEMIPPDGLSVSYLKNINMKHQVSMHVYKTDKKNSPNKIFYPKMLPVIIQWNDNHFVVVTKIYRKNVTLIDPAIGKVKYNYNDFMKKFSGYIITLSPNSSFTKKKRISEIIFPLKKIFKNRNTFLYIFSLFISQIVALWFSIILRDILNKSHDITYSFIMMISLVLFQTLSLLMKLGAQKNTNLLYESKISRQIFKGIFSRPLLYFRNNSVGTIIEKINLRTGIRDGILLKIFPSLLNFFTVFIVIIYLGTISFTLTLFLVIMNLLYMIFSFSLISIKRQANIQYTQQTIDFTSVVQEDLNQIEQIKAQANEKECVKRWTKKSAQTIFSYNKILNIDGITSAFNQGFNYICVILMMIFGIYLNQGNLVSIPDLIIFQSGISLFVSAVNQIQDVMFEISRLSIYGNKISDLLIENPQRIDNIEKHSNNAIILKDISYSYELNNYIFNNINFSIKKGEKIAIVGKSGSGKSTLFNILLGLISYEGEVTYGYENLRQIIGVVSQNMNLRKGSLIENIVSNNNSEELDIQKINDVLKDVNMLELVDSLPQKIFSQLFENGKNLSGGQIQRLLIAKSLLNNNKFIFWDEPFSSLDNQNRIHIYKNVLENPDYKSQTIIMISHHLDVLKYVDRVIYIDDKKIMIDKHNNLLLNDSYNSFVNE
ncbi:peptidase domain-containing ABC transporter [Lactococcus lactis]|uniref:Lacticin-481/lactococcin-DR transport/processing ATP-binding protein lcnDR3 n=1 Tax=Lactococcus lactis subsp. lactis TaxID=1360 RepID=LCN3_LACLL|nr:ABC transporter transmembrane domain-containing protein [Lactococcus lactis]P37608.1 RecName: Full=Lacticin-481/lactococcin-DR transport/processing ATP-binding protein lcnDR3 [Lactococcus lactis subsp. lactis]AAC72259.1 LctT [Lactococcus lactis subsp. lactis]MCT0080319.1 ATP-binding cassette domain-containing protein [Lactococcus lactis subsp. lactis]QLF91612.1 ATP-binding cassette domain-containing protein [Lactococcus lactis subsp. lactis]